jgi:two-component system chemotaxis response regulator CheY
MRRRVLIADDAAFMREMLRDILMDSDFEVVGEAANGDEAVSSYRELNPDLLTLDIVMPGKSGLDALREILSHDPTACVVMCSALGQEALVMEALESGARDFVVGHRRTHQGDPEGSGLSFPGTEAVPGAVSRAVSTRLDPAASDGSREVPRPLRR